MLIIEMSKFEKHFSLVAVSQFFFAPSFFLFFLPLFRTSSLFISPRCCTRWFCQREMHKKTLRLWLIRTCIAAQLNTTNERNNDVIARQFRVRPRSFKKVQIKINQIVNEKERRRERAHDFPWDTSLPSSPQSNLIDDSIPSLVAFFIES